MSIRPRQAAPLDRAGRARSERRTVNRVPVNMLTIDVEDWYHSLDPDPANWSGYEDRISHSVQRLLEILDGADTKATFFVLGHVAQRHPDLIREIHDRGHEVASHGFEHRFVYRQSQCAFRADVLRSVSLLSDIIGEPIRGYRAPYFSITTKSLWALAILDELGIEYDSSIFPVINHRYGIPNAPRLPNRTDAGPMEIPPSTYPFMGINVPCAGGVYFRVSPYAMTRLLLGRLGLRGEPVVLYLHPWEIDPGQPSCGAPRLLRLRHNWGLATTADKLKRLLRDFPFTSIREALDAGSGEPARGCRTAVNDQRRIKALFDRGASSFDAIYSGQTSPVKRLWNTVTRQNIRQRFEFTMEAISPLEGKRVLDVGCGSGRYCIEAALRGATEVVGIDLAGRMLELAADLAKQSGVAKRCRFEQTDVMEFRDPEGFDVVIANGFFDYIRSPHEVLARLRPLTRHVLVGTFPARYSLRAPFRRAWFLLRGCPVHFFTRSNVAELCERAGFARNVLTRRGPIYLLSAKPTGAANASEMPPLRNR